MVISKSEFAKQIDTAQNGEEALEYFDHFATDNVEFPKLIFLDLNMPIMGGWEFLDRFTESQYPTHKDTKVIVLSSTIDPQDIDKSKTYPMVIDFQSKPISKAMLDDLKKIF
jgi:CheY-like chemotaxis protein